MNQLFNNTGYGNGRGRESGDGRGGSPDTSGFGDGETGNGDGNGTTASLTKGDGWFRPLTTGEFTFVHLCTLLVIDVTV